MIDAFVRNRKDLDRLTEALAKNGGNARVLLNEINETPSHDLEMRIVVNGNYYLFRFSIIKKIYGHKDPATA